MTASIFLEGRGHKWITATVPDSYARGLLDYAALADDQGMYFPFKRDVRTVFHTHGMRFPIDVLFLDSRGRVVSIAESVPPGKTIASPVAYRAALELAAGTYAKYRPELALEITPRT